MVEEMTDAQKGRPPVTGDVKVRVSLSREEYEHLRECAEADDRTPPLMARVLIREALAKRVRKPKKPG